MIKKYFTVMVLLLLTSIILKAEAVQQSAVVSYIEGTALIQKKSGTDWNSLISNQKVFQGDRIQTKLGTKVVLLLADKSEFIISENSIVNITDLIKKDKAQKTEFKVFFGNIYARVKKMKSMKDSFKVATPVAVCGVRGTEFNVGVDNQGSNFSVMEGIVEVQSGNRKVVLKKEQKVDVKKVGEIGKVQKMEQRTELDNEPPKIMHDGIKQIELADLQKKGLDLDIEVLDNKKIESIIVRYRISGSMTEKEKKLSPNMKKQKLNLAFGQIKKDKPENIIYKISASDGRNFVSTPEFMVSIMYPAEMEKSVSDTEILISDTEPEQIESDTEQIESDTSQIESSVIEEDTIQIQDIEEDDTSVLEIDEEDIEGDDTSVLEIDEQDVEDTTLTETVITVSSDTEQMEYLKFLEEDTVSEEISAIIEETSDTEVTAPLGMDESGQVEVTKSPEMDETGQVEVTASPETTESDQSLSTESDETEQTETIEESTTTEPEQTILDDFQSSFDTTQESEQDYISEQETEEIVLQPLMITSSLTFNRQNMNPRLILTTSNYRQYVNEKTFEIVGNLTIDDMIKLGSISGKGTPNSEIMLYVNDMMYQTQTDNSGNFTVDNIEIQLMPEDLVVEYDNEEIIVSGGSLQKILVLEEGDENPDFTPQIIEKEKTLEVRVIETVRSMTGESKQQEKNYKASVSERVTQGPTQEMPFIDTIEPNISLIDYELNSSQTKATIWITIDDAEPTSGVWKVTAGGQRLDRKEGTEFDSHQVWEMIIDVEARKDLPPPPPGYDDFSAQPIEVPLNIEVEDNAQNIITQETIIYIQP